MSAEAEAPAEQRKKRPAAKQTGTAIIHSFWDERDEDYAPVDHTTYSGNLWNLFEVSYIADGKENTFSYDARGNRLTEIETYTGSNGRVTDYEYYENSDLIKKAGNWYFNYDKNGNLTARGTEAQDSGNELFSAWIFSETDGELWTYEYDLQNRMTKANYSGKGSANLKERGSYVYDYRGLLIKKTYQNYNPSDFVEVVNDEASKPVKEFYEYTVDGRVIYNERSEDNDTKKTTYIWANTTLWCEINEGVVYYHHTDHLGTTEVVTDQNGKVVWEAGYEAFGSVLSERGDSSFCPSYTGKFFDKASGLYYFNARWYESEFGRFTTSDPIRDGVNWWNYCNASPLALIDWTGLDAFNAVLKPSNYKGRSWFSKHIDEPFEKFLGRNFFGLTPADHVKLLDGSLVPMSESGERFSVSEQNFDAMFFCATALFSVTKLAKASNSLSNLQKVKQPNLGNEYARVDNISNVEKYGQSLGKDGQLFLTDKKTINGLDLTTKSGLQNAEDVLGLPRGQLSNSGINVVTTVDTTGLNVRLPTSGNEFFIPGGVTSGGAPEIVVNPMNIYKDPAVTSIQFIQQVE